MDEIKKLYNSVINQLLPHRCPVCNKINLDREGFCVECWSNVKIIKKPSCSICNYPFESDTDADMVCPECIRHRPLYKQAKSVFVYDDFVSKIIFDFKYRDKINNAKFFANLLKTNCSEIISLVDIIVPVPLHKKRLQQRKYNQALLIARHLAKMTNKELINDLLIRKINNRPQVGLIGKERLKNVKDVFEMNTKYLSEKNLEKIRGKNILLIDDVMTTGATLNNCTKALLKNFVVKDVYVLTVARTVVGQR